MPQALAIPPQNWRIFVISRQPLYLISIREGVDLSACLNGRNRPERISADNPSSSYKSYASLRTKNFELLSRLQIGHTAVSGLETLLIDLQDNHTTDLSLFPGVF